MATYNSLTSRTDSSALIAREDFDEIVKAASKTSAALQIFRRTPISTNQKRVPVLSALPIAYFVSPTDSGLKQTTEINWTSVNIEVEEAATIVPVPITVREDIANGRFNLDAELVPALAEAMAALIDGAIFRGTGAPTSWPDDITTGATAAGSTYAMGTNAVSKGGYAEDFNGAMAKIEDSGFLPTAWVASYKLRRYLRGARDANGQRLADFVGADMGTLFGAPIVYPPSDIWSADAGAPLAIGLDTRNFILGLRQEMRLDVFDSGVIQDGSGAIVYNLIQQDLIAIRATLRLGWAVANPVTREQGTEASRYPAVVITNPAA